MSQRAITSAAKTYARMWTDGERGLVFDWALLIVREGSVPFSAAPPTLGSPAIFRRDST